MHLAIAAEASTWEDYDEISMPPIHLMKGHNKRSYMLTCLNLCLCCMLHMIVKRAGGGNVVIGHNAVCNTVSDMLTSLHCVYDLWRHYLFT